MLSVAYSVGAGDELAYAVPQNEQLLDVFHRMDDLRRGYLLILYKLYLLVDLVCLYLSLLFVKLVRD